MYRYGLIFLLASLSLPAYANPVAPKLLGISITADDRATSLELDLSTRVPLSTVVKSDRIEIDLPTAVWDRSLPVKGAGGGVITDYRKLPTAHGISIVMHTNTRVKLDSSQGQADADGSQHITIRLVPEVEAQPVLAPVELYAPQIVQPVVQEVTGAGLETLPAQAVRNNQNQQNKPPVQPVKAAKPECAAHLVPAGRLGDMTGSYPVYKFSDCP